MPNTQCFRKRRAGFTLIELLVVIAVIAILVGITIGVARSVEERGNISRAQSELAALSQALEEYRSHYGDYPWIDSHTADAEDRSNILFQAMMGFRGPQGHDLDGTEQHRTFIDVDRFTLDNPSAALPEHERADDDASFLLDPWGNPYEYFYHVWESGQQGGRRPDGNWENSTYVLFSRGPSGEADDLETDGRPDYDRAANDDNIYANR